MSLYVMVCWRDADGMLTGPWPPAVETEAEAAELIRQGFAAGKRAGGTDIRGSVMAEPGLRVVARVRPK